MKSQRHFLLLANLLRQINLSADKGRSAATFTDNDKKSLHQKVSIKPLFAHNF
jgi:hypothetical protein